MISPVLRHSTKTVRFPLQTTWIAGLTCDSLRIRSFAFALLAIVLLTGLSWASAGSDGSNPKPAAPADYGKVSLAFEPNRGQTDSQVQFFSRGQGYGIFLTPGEAVLSLQQPMLKTARLAEAHSPDTSILRMRLVGADAKAVATPREQLSGTSNYFFGNDAKKWATDVPTYGKVQFKDVYPGVDLVYYGNQRQLEYDFVVAPNADARQIALSFSGAVPKLNAGGDLLLSTSGGETSFHKPVVYQMIGDAKVFVEAAYHVAKQGVTFSLGDYDHSKALVIDPVLSYGTFLGGSLDDRGFGIAADAAGNTYIVGDTVSLNFPLMNAIQSTNHNTSNGWVVFVTKLNPAGSAVVYSTFLGGIADSHALAVALDSTGSAYVAGYTSAGDFPVTSGAFQTLCGGNWTAPTGTRLRINGCSPSADTSAFLAKLAPAGNALVYSTFLGGSYFSQITSVAVDLAGEAYVAGNTNSSCGVGPYYPVNPFNASTYQCFPTTSGAYQTTFGGQTIPGSTIWGFFSKFSADGSTLLYSTEFLAPNGTTLSNNALSNTVNAVAVDAAGFGYIVGSGGYGLPTTAGAFYVPPVNSTTAPPFPAYVAKFDPTKSGAASLVYSTFLGSAAQTASNSNYTDVATGIAVDASGDAIVTGYTGNSCGYPTTAGAYQTGYLSAPYCADGFVTKLNPTGTGLIWSTLLGSASSSNIVATQLKGLSVGSNGNIYVVGNGSQSGFPLVGALHTAPSSGGGIVAELDPSGAKLLFSTYTGGFGTSGYSGGDVATAIATDANGNMYVTGRQDPNLLSIPTTPGALQTTYQGGPYDAFVLKIAPTIVSTTTLTVPTGTVTAGQSAILTATVAGPTGTTTVPTGTVTFLSGSTTLGTGTLNASGVATYTAGSLNATTYSITAHYAGDTNFAASVSSASTLVVSPATPTINLTAPATATVGASVTLGVTVTGTGGNPTGTVVFKDGTTTLSTMTLASGAASYSTSSLSTGTHSITVSYSGDSIFASGVSAAQVVTISVAPALTFTALPTSLTIVHGSTGTVVITGTPVGGYTGTATFTCGTLPTAASCTFAPTSLVFSGSNTAQSTTLTIATSMTTAGFNLIPGLNTATGVFAALLLFPLGFARRRKQYRRWLKGALLLVMLSLSSAAIVGLTGCSSSAGPTTTTTPAGSYSIVVTITAPNANSTITLPITVQ